MPKEVLITDLTKACGVPSSRVSEIAAGLGVAPGNKGRRLMTLSLADGIRIAVTREIMAAGRWRTDWPEPG